MNPDPAVSGMDEMCAQGPELIPAETPRAAWFRRFNELLENYVQARMAVERSEMLPSRPARIELLAEARKALMTHTDRKP